MTRSQAAVWASIAAIIGAAILYRLVSAVSPFVAEGQVNLPALLGFYAGVLLFFSGIGCVLALALHERWPALAGVDPNHPASSPAPEAAIRQGILLGVSVAALLILSMFKLVDPAFILVSIVLAGLMEVMWQSRPFGRA
jgi:hypothetical protein